ncbi:MAG: hypothetical protein ACWGON_01855 [Gemmatimonadota bacterium]
MKRRVVSIGAAFALVTPVVPASGYAQDSATYTAADPTPEYVTRALSLYASEPSEFDVREIVARWNDEGGLRSAHDSLMAARLWRRARETGEALAWLPDPASTADAVTGNSRRPDGLIHLERARILLMAPSRSRTDPGATVRPEVEGASDFWVACESADSSVARQIWLDLRSLFTPEEREAWEAADSGDRCEIVRAAIDDRAVRSALTPDERLAVHYRRLVTARSRYGIERPRYMKTASDYRGRPDSLEFDDRGYIWVRLGKPVDVFYVTRPPETELLGIEEDWVYERSGGVWLFHFVPCDTNRAVPCMPRSGFSLVESFGPLAIPGTFYFQRYVTRLALNPLPLKRMIFTYQAADPLDAALNEAERNIYVRQAQMIARELQTKAITEIPDVPGILPEIDLAFEPLRFWNPGLGTSTVWFIATARADQMEHRSSASGNELRIANLTLALRSPEGTTVRDVRREVESRPDIGAAEGVDVFLRTSLVPGPWPYTIAFRDGNADVPVGNWLQDTLVVPDFGGVYGSLLPALSDIAVAPDSGGAWTRDGTVFLPVTAAHVTGPDGTAHIYFEVYGIRPGDGYDVEIRLVPEDDADHIWQVDAEDLAYRISFSSGMSEESAGIGRHHLKLDLSDSDSGPYMLGVQVMKTSTGERSLPVTTPIGVLGTER